MTTLHTATRSELGLSATAPSSVTSYTATINVSGANLPFNIIDGTDGADTIVAASTTQYVFGFGGNDTISNEGSTAILMGGEGADTFIMYNLSTVGGFADGSIQDFEQGTDKLNLTQFGVTSFSELTITLNTEGETGSYARVESDAKNLALNLTSTGGLQNLNADDFIFSGDGGTDTGSGGGDTGSGGGSTGVGSFDFPTVNIGSATQTGTSGSDTVTGTSGNDILYGGTAIVDQADTADTVNGGAGNDLILGNGGGDSLNGDAGADTIYGGVASDQINGGEGNDLLYGGGNQVDPGDSADTINGGAGDDVILGNGGDDFLFGGEGNDTLHGGLGNNTYGYTGNDGNDTVLYFQGSGAAGGDVIQIASGINGGSITTAAAALAATTYSDGNAIVNLGSGSTVTISGIVENGLSSDDFSIV